MGNYIPCSTGRAAAAKAQVIVPGGETRKFQGRVKVAEVMLEHSSMFFVVNARSLHEGRRFCPLSADDDLELGESYVMFPLKRANSIVTSSDMAALLREGKDQSIGVSLTNKGSYGDKALDSGLEGYGSSLRGRDEGFEAGFGLGLMMASMEMKTWCRLSSCRSRRPSLETIIEEREPEHAR